MPITPGAKSIRIETKTQARASVTVFKAPKTGSAPARIRYNSFTVAVVVVFYSSPGIAEQLSQLPCVVIVVVGVFGIFELLVYYLKQPHLAHLRSSRQ